MISPGKEPHCVQIIITSQSPTVYVQMHSIDWLEIIVSIRFGAFPGEI